MQELVTVIIPTYNRIDTLERAINSVEKQTYKNIELIIIDDNANNENIRKEVRKIVSRHKNAKLIENKENLGGGMTRNEGIKKSNGVFIAFLDDDDEFYPQKIEKQYNLYQKMKKKDKNIGLIYCYADYVSPTSKNTRKVDYEGNPLKEHLILCIAATSWWFCPKEVLKKVGGFDNVSSHQDAILLFKILKNGYNIYRVPEVLLNYYVPDGKGITKVNEEWLNVDKRYMEMYFEIKDKFSYKEQKQIEYSFYKRMSSYNYKLKRKKELKENVQRMIKLYPFNFNTIKGLIKIILINFI